MSSANEVDQTLSQCLTLENPKSFFLFAGAGSGKTRSLITALKEVKGKNGVVLKLNNQRVAVITYTNAACKEILRRLDFDPLFLISTIHSFAWSLIKNYHRDIKEWLRDHIQKEIKDLRKEQSRGRSGTKAALNRAKKIESKTKRLDNLKNIKAFTYNPNGDNRGKDSLNHAEVIAFTACMLSTKSLMRNILTRSFPILLIDESQDTNRYLMEAFLQVQRECKQQFSLGLFGDTMQRIYADGKADLGTSVPEDWETPAKEINYRCPKRIIRLINRIRQDVDDHEQIPLEGKDEGVVRLFIVQSSDANKQSVEQKIMNRMSEFTNDGSWVGEDKDVKTLILEHHMAANRMGFLELFEPLYKNDLLKTGMIDGSLSGLIFFRNLILPLIRAHRNNNEFEIARIVRQESPLLSRKSLSDSSDQIATLREVKSKVDELLNLWSDETPRIIDVLYKVDELNLFAIPDSLTPISTRESGEKKLAELVTEENEEDQDEVLNAWDVALAVTFDQLEQYDEYMSNCALFDTHQSVKGLEFPRVMVVLDDEEAKGFLFSYEKLFGGSPLSATDRKNIQEGKETSVDRTRRLFYVTCSRAEKSLAIVAYTKSPSSVSRHVLDQGWFEKSEVIHLECGRFLGINLAKA